jgi:hypothetical protein
MSSAVVNAQTPSGWRANHAEVGVGIKRRGVLENVRQIRQTLVPAELLPETPMDIARNAMMRRRSFRHRKDVALEILVLLW